MPIPMIVVFVLCTLGVFISCLNFYLCVLRYPLHWWLGGTRADYHYISGYPLVGSLFIWISAFPLGLSGYPGLAWAAVAISLFDTGGIHWFIGTMLYWWLFDRED